MQRRRTTRRNGRLNGANDRPAVLVDFLESLFRRLAVRARDVGVRDKRAKDVRGAVGEVDRAKVLASLVAVDVEVRVRFRRSDGQTLRRNCADDAVCGVAGNVRFAANRHVAVREDCAVIRARLVAGNRRGAANVNSVLDISRAVGAARYVVGEVSVAANRQFAVDAQTAVGTSRDVVRRGKGAADRHAVNAQTADFAARRVAVDRR